MSTRMPGSDIEIAREATMQPISEVASRLGIPADALVPYGHGLYHFLSITFTSQSVY